MTAKNIGCLFIHKNGRQEVKYIEHLTPSIVLPIEYRRNATTIWGTGDPIKMQPEFGTEVYRHCGRQMDSQGRHTFRHIYAHMNWTVQIVYATVGFTMFEDPDKLGGYLASEVEREAQRLHPDHHWISVWVGDHPETPKCLMGKLMVFYPAANEAAKAVASADAAADPSDHA